MIVVDYALHSYEPIDSYTTIDNGGFTAYRMVSSDTDTMLYRYASRVSEAQVDEGNTELHQVEATPSVSVATPTPVPELPRARTLQEDTEIWRLTYYSCIGDSTGAYCGNTASGAKVRPGIAACGPSYYGATIRLVETGEILECLDTGSAVVDGQVDKWFYASEEGQLWLSTLGSYAEVEVWN